MVPNDADRFQFHVLDDVARVLDGESPEAASNGQTALKTLETVLSCVRSMPGLKAGCSWSNNARCFV